MSAGALLREAIEADRRFLAVVRSPTAYRELTGSEERLCELLEDRIAHTVTALLLVLEGAA